MLRAKRRTETGGSIQIFGRMADFRGYFTQGHATLGNFVQSGDDAHEKAFRAQTGVARRQFGQLPGDTASLSLEQRKVLERTERQLPHYLSLAEEIIALRKASDWNIAQSRLRDEALPESERVMKLL